MAHQIRKLTERSVRSIQRPGMYPDGAGLWLQVHRTGSRSWLYRYMVSGRRREMGLGSFLDVSLTAARDKRDEARRHLVSGIDPLSLKPQVGTRSFGPLIAQREREAQLAGLSDGQRARISTAPTLLSCWTAYVQGQETAWRGGKTKAGWMRAIELHAADIKERPVDTIDVQAIVRVLDPLWTTKAESAGKLRERLERVLDYAKVMKYRTGDNPAVWKGNLVHLLPPRPKLQRGHMRALPHADMPAFMRDLARKDGMASRALEYTVLTVARESMTLQSTWSEIHDEDLWVLDASRMKERAFRQPLSTGAQEVLARVRPEETGANVLVFPGAGGAVMSNAAMDKVLKDMRVDATPHGMRSSFRDWAGDETDYARETIEECLSHVVGDETERAYRRSDALRKRRDVLQSWSDYCCSLLP